MDWLRKIVSGKRNRFEYKDFNLDITYITFKILAMSFPAHGVESFYRNNISKVKSQPIPDSIPWILWHLCNLL